MTSRRPYTYMLLRYRHDPAAGEIVNVGVLVHSPSSRFVGIRVRHTAGRLAKTFPDMDTETFKATLRSIERSAQRLCRAETGHLLATIENANSLAQRILPHDDSSFVWSGIGSGIATDAEEALARLYERFVGMYDDRSRSHRDDAAVWRPVRDRLAERNLAGRLQEKTISSSIDRVHFEHAWKNGSWHCYQPLSFDLANEDNIREKAARWVGHMTALAEVKDEFKPHFFVGAPGEASLAPAYNAALKILSLSPVQPAIVEERDIDLLVNQIEDEIRAHDDSQA